MPCPHRRHCLELIASEERRAFRHPRSSTARCALRDELQDLSFHRLPFVGSVWPRRRIFQLRGATHQASRNSIASSSRTPFVSRDLPAAAGSRRHLERGDVRCVTPKVPREMGASLVGIPRATRFGRAGAARRMNARHLLGGSAEDAGELCLDGIRVDVSGHDENICSGRSRLVIGHPSSRVRSRRCRCPITGCRY